MTQLRLVAELAGHEDRVWQLSWDPSGNRLASCSGDKSARIWSPISGAVFFENPQQAPAIPSSSSKANSGLAGESAMDVDQTSAQDTDAIVKTTRSWQCLDTIDNAHKRTVRSVVFEPTRGKSLATASFDGTTAIWEKDYEDEDATYECVATLEGHENEAKCVSWSPSGQLLATCGRDKSVWIWESNGEGDFDCISVLMEHTHDVKSVVWHPRDEILASFSYDDTIRLWKEDDDDWYSAATLTGHASTVWGGAFSPDGTLLASVSDDRTVRVWAQNKNTSGGVSEGFYHQPEISYKCIAVVPDTIHRRAIYSVSWSSHANTNSSGDNVGYLATGCGDNTLRVFKVSQGSQQEQAAGQLNIDLVAEQDGAHGLSDINCVKWNPVHPNWLASAGDDGIVRIWYLEQ